MMRFILLFVFSLSRGFLLQTNSPLITQTGGNQQFITKSELYDTKNQLQNEVNYVRNDMNTKLDLLTSQLQQMLASFQQQLTGQRSHNDSKSVESVELKYNEVMVNYTKLQKEFDSLQIKYSKQEIELQSVKNNINQLPDFRLLQREVQSISTQTHSLAVDFQAFYNTLKEHKVNEDGTIQILNSTLCQKIHSSEVSTNASLTNVLTRISELEYHQNSKIEDIRQQIVNNKEKVALTACTDAREYYSGPHPTGHIIKYGDIRTQVNVNNLFSFTSSGKFTCEKEGLYLVSAWDASYITGSEFSIYKNGILIANAFITGTNNHYYTATAVVALELLPNDTVWVQVLTQMYVSANKNSCLTVVKVQ